MSSVNYNKAECDQLSDNGVQAKRKHAADSIVNRYAGLGTAAALIPVPLMDQAALTGLQLSLMARLSDLYGVPFSREAGRNVLLSLVGGAIPHSGGLAIASLAKSVPGAGSLLGMIAAPALGGSVTYAIGRVMIRHYESGGDLLNLDTSAARKYFQSQLKRAPRSDPPKTDVNANEGARDGESNSEVEPDDLQQIVGIGPRFAERLHVLGITSFNDLATADMSRLARSISNFDPRIHDIDSWQAQARLLAAGKAAQ